MADPRALVTGRGGGPGTAGAPPGVGRRGGPGLSLPPPPPPPTPPISDEPLALRPDPNARERPPGLLTNPLSIIGTPAAATASALGSMIDRPGDLGAAGRAAWETATTAPYAASAAELPSPSGELQKRGVEPGLPGLIPDMVLDPSNLVGGEPVTDLSKVGLAGAAALPDVFNFAKKLITGRGAAKVDRALGALEQRWPAMTRALGRAEGSLQVQGARRSPAAALDRVTQTIYDATLANPGSTTNVLTGQIEIPEKSTGFLAGKYSNQSGKTQVVPLTDFSPAHVRAFIEQHADEFARDPDLYVGTWKGDKNGAPHVYLDVARKFETEREAVVSSARQKQPKIDPRTALPVERDPLSGKWPTPQEAVFALESGSDVPVGNFAEFVASPEFEQRMNEMYQAGQKVMGDKEWWNLYGGPLEKIYGKALVRPLAGFLASTSPGSTPVHNFRAATEYLRRLINEEPIIQRGFRIPKTAVGHHPGPLGGFSRPGKRMPMEQSRAGNLRKVAAGQYDQLQEDKVNDMFHALTGEDIGVYDRRWAKLAEDWKRGIYAEGTKDKLKGSMVTGQPGSYALLENAGRTAAKKAGVPYGRYTSTVWEGIGDTIKETGELYGMAHPAGAIPEVSGGFNDFVGDVIADKAKRMGVSVATFKKMLREGKASALTALLSTSAGVAAYQRFQQEDPARSSGPPPPPR